MSGGLFEIPEQPAVHPVKLSPGRGTITYEPLGQTRPCTDCTTAQIKHATGDLWATPMKPVLPADVARRQGGRVAFLCPQHAQLRKEHDEQIRPDANPGVDRST